MLKYGLVPHISMGVANRISVESGSIPFFKTNLMIAVFDDESLRLAIAQILKAHNCNTLKRR